MALNPKAIASWGLLAPPVERITQVVEGAAVTLEVLEPLAVELAAAEITVELNDGS
jgi:hypothetical protein